MGSKWNTRQLWTKISWGKFIIYDQNRIQRKNLIGKGKVSYSGKRNKTARRYIYHRLYLSHPETCPQIT